MWYFKAKYYDVIARLENATSENEITRIMNMVRREVI